MRGTTTNHRVLRLNLMPSDLSTGGVDHNHDCARITVTLGVAGDVTSDARAVLDG